MDGLKKLIIAIGMLQGENLLCSLDERFFGTCSNFFFFFGQIHNWIEINLGVVESWPLFSGFTFLNIHIKIIFKNHLTFKTSCKFIL